MLNNKVYLVLGMALPCESGFLVTLDADNLLYPFVATSDDVVVTGHELFLKKFFWTLDTKPATIHIKECQSAIYGEPSHTWEVFQCVGRLPIYGKTSHVWEDVPCM